MPVVIAGLILSFLVMMVFGGTELDRTLLALFTMIDAPGVRQAAGWLSAASTPLPLIPAVLVGTLVLAVRVQWQQAVLLLGIVASGHFLVDAIQSLARPLRLAVDHQLPVPAGGLYPSAHTAAATVAGLALAFILTRSFPARAWALAAATLFALIVGLARLVLGASWPSDVIGGWALGLAWSLLILLLARSDVGDGTPSQRKQSR